ncbi:DUF4177 domain-containing protein [Pelagivirga sediminicola]|uniref:DUF4177 domain-containing protein n=1 Tax=Pelagivirga sediminicola TaxID=2170575 RepID=UPI001402C411|nr:DUF4177 domain-containing protein [Pelagivirga sediminicola]
MTHYEYKVIPAPSKGEKAQGIKAPEARFAKTVEGVLNAQAAAGWEYLRTDILPSDERAGLTSTQTVYRTLLVFRRAKGGPDAAGDVITTAQNMAEAAAPDTPKRREPSFASVQPTRGDPAPKPDAPEPQTPEPDTPEPDTPEPERPEPETKPDTPGPDTPRKE